MDWLSGETLIALATLIILFVSSGVLIAWWISRRAQRQTG